MAMWPYGGAHLLLGALLYAGEEPGQEGGGGRQGGGQATLQLLGSGGQVGQVGQDSGGSGGQVDQVVQALKESGGPDRSDTVIRSNKDVRNVTRIKVLSISVTAVK